jgi:hypothetical protein
MYAPSDCFETFTMPVPSDLDHKVRQLGAQYYDYRSALMIAHNQGMTKTYNRFHDRADNSVEICGLRELHAEMDRAVLMAYGWSDLATRSEAIWLDDGNEPEHTYQGRLFWSSTFRDEVLSRLLALNAERAAAERAAGLFAAPAESDEAA